MDARLVLAIVLLVMAAAAGALGVLVFATERGVANEIKGFVLLLIGAVMLVGGCVLWELRAIRKALQARDSE